MPTTDADGAAEPALATVDLARSPSHLLHRALQQALDHYSEELGEGAPTQRQFALLNAAAADGRTQTDLVNATGIDRSTLADMVARMMARGLLQRERSSVDGRANLVRLTDAGRAMLESASPRVRSADARILSRLSPKGRAAFLDALTLLSGAEPPVAAAPAREKPPKAPKPGKLAKSERGDKKKKKKAKKT